MDPIVSTELIELVWNGVDHPEGVACAEDGVVWCGGEEGQIYRGPMSEPPAHIATLPGRTLGFAIDRDGNAYCAELSSSAVYRITIDGQVDLISRGTTARPAIVPNYPAFLPTGALLFTDSGNWGENDGCIFAVSQSGQTTIAATSTPEFPNGLAVAPDHQSLAVVESTLPGVSSLEINPDGSLGERTVLVEMPGTVPDGVAYDVDGRLLISCWAPDAIYILGRDGAIQTMARDDLRFVLNQPTNIAFIPGTSRVVVANIGERFLSVLSHTATGAPVLRPEFAWPPTTNDIA